MGDTESPKVNVTEWNLEKNVLKHKNVLIPDCNQKHKKSTCKSNSIVRMGSLKSLNSNGPNHCTTIERQPSSDTSCCENIRLQIKNLCLPMNPDAYQCWDEVLANAANIMCVCVKF